MPSAATEAEPEPGRPEAASSDGIRLVRTRKAPSARNCKPYVRRRLASALPEIADALIDRAQQGSLPELKMLVQMSGLDEKGAAGAAERRRGKSLEEMLMKDWRKEPLDEPND